MKKINIQKTITRAKALIWAIRHCELRFAIVVIRLAFQSVLPMIGQRTAAQGTGDGTAL